MPFFVRRRQKRGCARCIPLRSKILLRYELWENSQATRIPVKWKLHFERFRFPFFVFVIVNMCYYIETLKAC